LRNSDFELPVLSRRWLGRAKPEGEAPHVTAEGPERAEFPMSETESVRTLVLAAGDMALRMRGQAAVHRKADRSFVTDADLAVQTYLIDELSKRYPDDGFVAEEQDVGRTQQTARRLWVLDPIDGTASYASGLPGWGVSVGLVEDGRAVAGWFYLPVTGEVFEARADVGMRAAPDPQTPLQPAGLREPKPFHRESAIFVDSGFHKRFALDPSFPGKVRSVGTTVGHLAYVAAGCADAVVLGDVHLWDIASGMAMVAAAGGVTRYFEGTDVDIMAYVAGEEVVRPMISGHAETVARLAPLVACRE
jgi:fructose-1,6-bisphosphatase/inositol monophosphatase family enzyme